MFFFMVALVDAATLRGYPRRYLFEYHSSLFYRFYQTRE